MRSLKIAFIVTILLATAVVGTAAASTDVRWLNFSPVRFFTEQDWEMARETVRRALEDGADGETVEWTNPDSGSRGTITPTGSTGEDGETCRAVKITNHANGLEGGGTFEFCRQADGSWGAVSQGGRR